MKRKFLILFCLGALALGGCAPTMERLDSLEASAEKLLDFSQEALESGAMGPKEKPGKGVSRERAEALALEHAGLTRQQVTRLQAEYDTEEGKSVFDVEFCFDGWEYHYEICAETGEILSVEREKETE